eukprot:4968703-Amphidinium_carterae.1
MITDWSVIVTDQLDAMLVALEMLSKNDHQVSPRQTKTTRPNLLLEGEFRVRLSLNELKFVCDTTLPFGWHPNIATKNTVGAQ